MATKAKKKATSPTRKQPARTARVKISTSTTNVPAPRKRVPTKKNSLRKAVANSSATTKSKSITERLHDLAKKIPFSKSDPKADDRPIFTLFSDLPLEIRAKIWGLAAPDPYIVCQRESSKVHKRWTFSRPVPGVLHACRESRYEFLENEDSGDPTLDRRRREHPVYKLYFRTGRTRSSPVFFSEAIDTFWGELYEGVQHRVMYSPISGISELDVSHVLRYLTIPIFAVTNYNMRILVQSFPNLKLLTILLSILGIDRHPNDLVLPPEKDGELNAQDLTGKVKHTAILFIRTFRSFYAAAQQNSQQYPGTVGRTPPTLKFRSEKQYIENENIQTKAMLTNPFNEYRKIIRYRNNQI